MSESPMVTLAVLHPGVETPEATNARAAPAKAAMQPASPRLAPRLSSLRGKRLALFENGKVNALEIVVAVGKRLESRHGIAETRTWRKRHAGESGEAVIPGVVDWKPDLVLTALGD